MQTIKSIGTRKSTKLPELHVPGQSELPPSLHVETDQVHPESGSHLLEQMIGNFLSYGVIHSLCHLIHQAHEVLIQYSSSVEVVWSSDEVRKAFGS